MEETLKEERISLRAQSLGLYMVSLSLGTISIPIGGSLLKYLALLPIFLNIVFLLKVKQLKINQIHVLYGLYVMIIILSLFYTVDFDESIGRLISNLSFVILLLTVTVLPYNKTEVSFIRKSYVWAARITAIFTISLGTDIDGGRISLDNGIFVEDPNYLVGYFIFALIFAIDSILEKKISLLKRVIYFSELLTYIYIILITGSRGGMAAVVLAILFYLMFTTFRNKKMVKTIATIIIFTFIAMLVMPYIVEKIPVSVIERFSYDAVVNSGGTGRYELWSTAINIYQNSSLFHQIFGYGAATITSISVDGYYLWNVTHNLWLESLLELGLLGFISFLFIIYLCLKITLRQKDIIAFATLIGIIGLSMSLSLQSYKPLWNLVIVILLYTPNLTRSKEWIK